jgi:hypothetical protein
VSPKDVVLGDDLDGWAVPIRRVEPVDDIALLEILKALAVDDVKDNRLDEEP